MFCRHSQREHNAALTKESNEKGMAHSWLSQSSCATGRHHSVVAAAVGLVLAEASGRLSSCPADTSSPGPCNRDRLPHLLPFPPLSFPLLTLSRLSCCDHLGSPGIRSSGILPPVLRVDKMSSWLLPRCGPSTLLSTIFRASLNASAGVDAGIVAANLSPSSSYTVTMKPVWRVRSSRWKW